jgi:hypothetical protein
MHDIIIIIIVVIVVIIDGLLGEGRNTKEGR